jgi:two-component system, NtrC family, sensor histidine kinase HydH
MADRDPIDARTEHLLREQLDANYRRTSRLLAVLMAIQWVFAISISLTFSPYAWSGTESSVHVHVWTAIFLGAAISSLPVYLAITRPAAAVTRYTMAVGQMLWSALLIHLMGGRIETHFHVFGSLAFLAFYRDWKVLIPATLVVASDHLGRQMFWPESVYGVANPEWWRFVEHALWVVFEDTVLIAGCFVAVSETRKVARSHAEVECKSRDLQAAMHKLESAQEALVRTEKLAAVGQLAASVGHELRNPLTAVRNANAYIAKKVRGDGADPRVVQFSQLIDRELNTCSKIISDLLDFARERPLVVSPAPLRDLVEEAIGLVPASKIDIVNAVPDDLPIPVIDKEQFRQVVINLTQNAVEAIEPQGGGRVTVSADAKDARFRLLVEDDGPGIPQDVIAKMFEPLFTTKVKGTGLGLAIVQSIVKRHQGDISIDSTIGQGTRFVVDWPALAPSAEPSRREAAE